MGLLVRGADEGTALDLVCAADECCRLVTGRARPRKRIISDEEAYGPLADAAIPDAGALNGQPGRRSEIVVVGPLLAGVVEHLADLRAQAAFSIGTPEQARYAARRG